jgi:hypothetical protein
MWPSHAFRQRRNLPLESPILWPFHLPFQRPSPSPPDIARNQAITQTPAQRPA